MILVGVLCFSIGCVAKDSGKNAAGDSNVYTIETKVQGAGSINVVSSAKEGENIKVLIEQDKGVTLTVFKVNNVDKISEINGNVYMLQNVNENTTIVAEFQYDGRAIYATKVPKIDGKIDRIWESAEKLYTDGHRINIIETTKSQNHGYASIMWNEETLYFFWGV